MPTATAFDGFQVTNLGPLTTTFTAPSSCYTATQPLYLAKTNGLPWGGAEQNVCTVASSSPCVPSGAAIDRYMATSYLNNQQTLVPYYSPGIACPAGWTTAGATSRNTDGSPGTASGAFSVSTTTPNPPFVQQAPFLPGHIALAQVLDAGETAVVCCPSGYTVSPNRFYCYSDLPTSVYQPAAGATACWYVLPAAGDVARHTTLTLNGQEVATAYQVVTVTDPATRTTTTVALSDATAMVGVRRFHMLNLVHKASDLPAGGGDDSSSSTQSSSSSASPSNGAPSPTPSKPAASSGSLAGDSNPLRVMVVAAAMAVGAALILRF